MESMDITVLELIIEQVEDYQAHVGKIEDKESETLIEHTKRTKKYFEDLWERKGLEKIFDELILQLCGEISIQAREFWKELIWGIIIFHDSGKMNSEFQKKKMKNKLFKNAMNIFSCIGSKHSILSALIYIDYFWDRLKNQIEDKEERCWLKKLLIYHAYIIERHHSDLSDFSEFLQTLREGAGRDVLKVLCDGKCPNYKKQSQLDNLRLNSFIQDIEKREKNVKDNQEKSITKYTYIKLLYSLLVASDFYATAEFMSGVKVREYGELNEISKWIETYEDTDLMKKIRKYQKEEYPTNIEEVKKTKDINQLRTEILCETEEQFEQNKNENIFYLESPTGSGKSNVALNLSFQMIKKNTNLKKIYYIYPFNNLVEQNLKNLEKIFGKSSKFMDDVAVINSLTPVKMTEHKKKEESESEQTMYYQRALLDRQFLNYPMIVSTHVSLFDTMFGYTKESAFGFHQLVNSVIVLDEIQSYKNIIWGEIICFLKRFASLLNIKVIIMSATLPNLDILSENSSSAVMLLLNREKYFLNSCFKNRVSLSYELLEKQSNEQELLEHVKKSAMGGKNILIEFIKKETAYRFFQALLEEDELTCDIEYMSGEDSILERSRILNKIKEKSKQIILVATQVVEAGVDMENMDIGYKNISKLDSEEQFLGRINRSFLKYGVVYFFKLDEPRSIYRENDIRIEEIFTLNNKAMRDILENKEFDKYYNQILEVLKKNFNNQINEEGLQQFFEEKVGKLKWFDVNEKMKLILEDTWSMQVYLARTVFDETGEEINGEEVWREYVKLLENHSMDYAEWKVKLSRITSKMNIFIYQIKKNLDMVYDDKVGEIFYIEDGEKYFENGKLNRKKIQGELGEFVDFI